MSVFNFDFFTTLYSREAFDLMVFLVERVFRWSCSSCWACNRGFDTFLLLFA